MGAAAAIPAITSLGGGRALASAAPSAASHRRPTSGDPVELQLVYYGDVNQQAAWEALFTAFNESNPDIRITPNGVAAPSWGEYVTTVATQLAGGREYDIVYVATEGQRLLASRTSCCRSTTTSPPTRRRSTTTSPTSTPTSASGR